MAAPSMADFEAAASVILSIIAQQPEISTLRVAIVGAVAMRHHLPAAADPDRLEIFVDDEHEPAPGEMPIEARVSQAILSHPQTRQNYVGRPNYALYTLSTGVLTIFRSKESLPFTPSALPASVATHHQLPYATAEDVLIYTISSVATANPVDIPRAFTDITSVRMLVQQMRTDGNGVERLDFYIALTEVQFSTFDRAVPGIVRYETWDEADWRWAFIRS